MTAHKHEITGAEAERYLARANAQRAEGMPWKHIAESMPVTIYWLRMRLDPEFKERVSQYGSGHKRNSHKHKKPLEDRIFAGRPMSDAELAAYRESIPDDTRDFTARFCGDPLPGRSALDMKRAGA